MPRPTTVSVIGSRWAVDGIVAALGRDAAVGRESTTPALVAIARPVSDETAVDPATADTFSGDGLILAGPSVGPVPPDVIVVVADEATRARGLAAAVPADVPLLLVGSAPALAGEIGAAGWLPADVDGATLAIAVRALAVGLIVSADRATSIGAGSPPRSTTPDGRRGDGGELLEPLTARELEVYELMAKGLGNRDIGAALGISSHTAKFHVGQILEKTGSATRTEAVRLGLRWGLIGL